MKKYITITIGITLALGITGTVLAQRRGCDNPTCIDGFGDNSGGKDVCGDGSVRWVETTPPGFGTCYTGGGGYNSLPGPVSEEACSSLCSRRRSSVIARSSSAVNSSGGSAGSAASATGGSRAAASPAFRALPGSTPAQNAIANRVVNILRGGNPAPSAAATFRGALSAASARNNAAPSSAPARSASLSAPAAMVFGAQSNRSSSGHSLSVSLPPLLDDPYEGCDRNGNGNGTRTVKNVFANISTKGISSLLSPAYFHGVPFEIPTMGAHPADDTYFYSYSNRANPDLGYAGDPLTLRIPYPYPPKGSEQLRPNSNNIVFTERGLGFDEGYQVVTYSQEYPACPLNCQIVNNQIRGRSSVNGELSFLESQCEDIAAGNVRRRTSQGGQQYTCVWSDGAALAGPGVGSSPASCSYSPVPSS